MQNMAFSAAENGERVNIELQQQQQWDKALFWWWRVMTIWSRGADTVRIGSREDLGCYRPFFSIEGIALPAAVCRTSHYRPHARVVMMQSIQRRSEDEAGSNDGDEEYATIKIH